MVNHLAATTVVYNPKTEKFLLVKRTDSRDINPSKWEFPGGGVKEDETPRQAALRELEEETGLKAEIVKTGETGHIEASIGEIEIHPFLVTVDTEEVVLSKEHDNYEWLTTDKIEDLDTVEGILKELKALNIDV